MFCPQCGSENKETARFCTGCGASLEAVAKVLEKVRADEEQAVSADGSSEAAKTEDAGLTASSQDACEDGALAGDGAHETEGVGVMLRSATRPLSRTRTSSPVRVNLRLTPSRAMPKSKGALLGLRRTAQRM